LGVLGCEIGVPGAVRIEEWALTQNLVLTNPPGVPTHRGEGNQRDTVIDLIWMNVAAVLDDAFRDPVIDFAALMGLDHTGIYVAYQYILESAINHPQLTWYIIDDKLREAWTERYCNLSWLPTRAPLSTEEVE
jgi:hypothetical protein